MKKEILPLRAAAGVGGMGRRESSRMRRTNNVDYPKYTNIKFRAVDSVALLVCSTKVKGGAVR